MHCHPRPRLSALTVLLLSGWSLCAHAELLFSEYVEGSGSNKALEIHNPGPDAVDLSGYTVEQYSNGRATPGASFALRSTLAAGAVHVLAHTSLAATLGARASQTANLGFNGDDALVLRRGGTAVDRIGQVGHQPEAGYWGSGETITRDRTLRRRLDVAQGDAAFDAPFDPARQWLAHGKDELAGLGAYEGDAGSQPPPASAACGAPDTLIADIQGSGPASPLEGQRVQVEAVVTGNYTHADGFGGFFVQQADARRVHRAGTPEGIFVYAPRLDGQDLRAGSLVHLAGTVREAYGQTQIDLESNVAHCAAAATASAAPLALPLAEGSDFSAYEGMLLELPQTLAVNDVYELGRYGSIVLADGLLPIPTHVADPGTAAQAQAQRNARRRIVLDDGSNRQNPEAVIYPPPGLAAGHTLRRGHTTRGVRGILEMRHGAWRLQPVPGDAPPAFDASANPRPEAPARAEGSDIRVAAFNVLNYFNGDDQGGGFDDPDNRGAASAEEFERQEAKIVAALRALDADVIGLMEIANNGYGSTSAIQRLSRQLGAEWRFASVPGLDRLGGDAIAVGLLYRADRVRATGQAATLAIDDRSRQPLAQTFEPLGGGQSLTVVANHFKSKSCGDAAGADADQGDGQSCWNPTRERAARSLAQWLATAPTGVEGSATLIVGDLNSYAREAPIQALEARGYADLLARARGPGAYTYVFGGEAGYLDHALGDDRLRAVLKGADVWHINADEPSALQYTLQYKSPGQQQGFYAPDAYRSSDHDPVVVDLALSEAAAPGAGGGQEGPVPQPGQGTGGEGESSGGGAMTWGVLGLLALAGGAWRRRARRPAA